MTLKEIRKNSGLKAYKVAEILGISRVQLNNLENGRYNFDKLKIAKLSEVYKKDESEIVMAIQEGSARYVGK